MDSRVHCRWRRASFLLLAGVASFSRVLAAQAPPLRLLAPEPADALASEPAASTTSPARPSALQAQSTPGAASGPSVELLPAHASAPSTARGIAGGSLAWTSHGLQWPYLPARPGQPRARIALSGLAWVDSSYRAVEAGSAGDADRSEWEQTTRAVLRATPTYSVPGDWFVQGQLELVLRGATSTSAEDSLGADDVYVRAGKWSAFDLTAGRFQGWEVYHLGLGLEQNTTERRGAWTAQRPALDVGTDLQFSWERRAGPGNLALHLYPLEFLRFELLGSFGAVSSGVGAVASRRNALGVRPAGILDFGVIKAKVAADYVRESPAEQSAERAARTLRRGVVGALQSVLEPLLELGVSGGYALVDDYDGQGAINAAGSHTTYGFGGFGSVRITDRLLLGTGGAYTHRRNLRGNASGTRNDLETHGQLFGAVQYSPWEQLHIKIVFAYASALADPRSEPVASPSRNRSLSGRVRLAYAF